MLRRSFLRGRSMNFTAFCSEPHPQFQQGRTQYTWRRAPPQPEEGGRRQSSSSSSPSHRGDGSGISVHHSLRFPVVLSEASVLDRLKLLGMPRGYPQTCARGFRRYFYLSVTAAFVGNFATSIATQTLLGGFFADASPRVWMMKDLVPAIMAAFIANKMVSYELRPKYWLVVYAVLTNISTVSDMCIPSMVPPDYLLVAAVVTSMIKQSAMLMFFVTRASALQHFATHNNLAEFTKKFNSFGMVNFTVATALGIAFTSLVTSFTVQLGVVATCCWLNILINYASMAPIAFRVLNPTTAHIVFRHFVLSDCTMVPSPDAVSATLGLRGVVHHDTEKELTDMFLVSPAIHSLNISSASIERDMMGNPALPFAFGLWGTKRTTLAQRQRAKGGLRALLYRRRRRHVPLSESVFGPQTRLVLLVGAQCDNKHLLCAYLIGYAALMEAHRNAAELQQCVRNACTNHKLWMQKTELLLLHLQDRGWQTSSLSLDPVEMRLSMHGTEGGVAGDNGVVGVGAAIGTPWGEEDALNKGGSRRGRNPPEDDDRQ